jgi:ABC-type transporter Mla MlaB component
MTLKFELDSDVLKLNGRFTEESIKLVEDLITAFLKSNSRIIVDLSFLNRIDVECIYFLEDLQTIQREQGKTIHLRRVNNIEYLRLLKYLISILFLKTPNY